MTTKSNILLEFSVLKKIFSQTWQTFSLSMLIAITGTICSIVLIGQDYDNNMLVRIIWTLLVGFALAIPLEWYFIKRNYKFLSKLIYYILFIILLLIHYFVFVSDDKVFLTTNIIRELLWGGSFIMLITCLPLLRKDYTNQYFWKHNMLVLVSLLISGLVSAILIAGIFVALATIDGLFDNPVDFHLYPQVWTFVVGIVGSTIFLAMISKNDSHNFARIYEILLNIGKFILIPLVIAYFVILYVYSIYVLAEGVWPEHIVAYMIAGFSILAIFSTMFLWPLANDYKWMRYYQKAIYVAIIPQVLILLWAVSWPLQRYGWTENRYLVILFGVWLLVVSLYMIFSAKKDWRTLPLSLFAMVFLATIGPWGMFNISKNSQTNRLINIASELSMIKDGHLTKTTEPIDSTNEIEINNILVYLFDNHGVEAIKPLFAPGELDQIIASNENDYEIKQKIVTEKLGLNFFVGSNPTPGTFNYSPQYDELNILANDIAGYDFEFDFFAPPMDGEQMVTLGQEQYLLKLDSNNMISLTSTSMNKKMVFDFDDFVTDLNDKYQGLTYQLPQDELKTSIENDQYSALIIFSYLDGEVNGNKTLIKTMNATVYLKIK